jgi:hypothetical protein
MPHDLRPCWHCTHWAGIDPSPFYTRCSAPLHSVTQADPWHGCSAFERQVGADDEPGPPLGFRGSSPDAPGWRSVVAVKPAGADLYRPGRHPLLTAVG